MMYLPRAECVFWVTAKLILSLATITLNVITIITFVSHRQVRKRSTYILISLAVADMMVGAVTGPTDVINFEDVSCELWKLHIERKQWYLLVAAGCVFFPLVSLSHLVAVSLERFYVTLCPFKYRSVKDKAYGTVIATVWLIPTLTTIALGFAVERAPIKTYVFTRSCYVFVALVTICVCYLITFIKVRCSSPPRRHGAANREKKLTITLFIVTAVSLLTWLPWVVFNFGVHYGDFLNKMSGVTSKRIDEVVIILYLANSIVNPIVYAIRMPEFRKGASTLLLACAFYGRKVQPTRD